MATMTESELKERSARQMSGDRARMQREQRITYEKAVADLQRQAQELDIRQHAIGAELRMLRVNLGDERTERRSELEKEFDRIGDELDGNEETQRVLKARIQELGGV